MSAADKMEQIGNVAEFKRGPFGSSIKKSVCVPKGPNTYKLYEQGNVINNDFERDKYYITKEKFEELSHFEIKTGDLLLTCAGTLGKIAIVPENIQQGIINSVLMRIRIDENKVIRNYIYYYFQSPKIQNDISKQSAGVAIKNLFSTKLLKRYTLYLPDISEQELICQEIETQFTRLNEAKVALKRIKANLKRYKASVLKAAVEGKLTEKWRLSARKRAQVEEMKSIPKAEGLCFVYVIECSNGSYYIGYTSDLQTRWTRHCQGEGAEWTKHHPPKYLIHFETFKSQDEALDREKELKTGFGRKWVKREVEAGRLKPLVHNSDNPDSLPVRGVQTGSELLKRILTERQKKWEEAELKKVRAKGKEPKDDKRKKKYKEPVAPDTSNLPELPDGWVWANIEQLAEAVPNAIKAGPFGSSLKKSFYVQKGYKIYGQEQVLRDDPYYGDYYINEERFQKLSSCAVKPGDILISLVGTIGRVLILPVDIEPGIINPRLVKLSLDCKLIDSRFFKAYLQSPYVRYLFSLVSHGGTMDILNLTILKEVPIPLPPIVEQITIINELERVTSIEVGLETEIDKSVKRAERLRQSILKKAFSGKLLTQEAKGKSGKSRRFQYAN